MRIPPLLTCFCKPDLDTVAAAWILTRRRAVFHLGRLLALPGPAPAALLDHPRVLCLECGGSGRVADGNFDHHGENLLPCATEQAWQAAGEPAELFTLTDYVARVDCGLFPPSMTEAFPLSALFSGMLLCHTSPCRRFRAGLELLEQFFQAGLSPLDVRPLLQIPHMARYAAARAEARHHLESQSRRAFSVRLGTWKLMILETELPGVHGMLRRLGADISLAGSGHPRRWTLSARPELRWLIQAALPLLAARESGWGGPAGGGIIGSPRSGSVLTGEDIANCVRQALASGPAAPLSRAEAASRP